MFTAAIQKVVMSTASVLIKCYLLIKGKWRASYIKWFIDFNSLHLTEQVRKGGLPPLVPDLSDWVTAGVNRPSLTCTNPGASLL
jgi:hypothetical protein